MISSPENNITEFRDWLLMNRSSIQNSLRKFKAAKSYFVTIAIGCSLFAAHSIYKTNDHHVASILCLLICGIILATSGRISESISGLKEFTKLPAYINEKNHFWLSGLPSLTGESHSLLSNSFVKKALKDSSNHSINKFIFFNALVLISDAVQDKIKTPE
jgi:hypothetical protein